MAVYTHINDTEFKAFLQAEYALEIQHITPIAEGVENSNYLLTLTDNSRLIGTVFEKRVDVSDLPFFMQAMQHLHAHEVSCPTPVLSKQQQSITHIAGKPFALTRFLEGKPVLRPNNAQMRALGTALAQFHKAGASFPLTRSNSMGTDAWPSLWHLCRTHEAATPYASSIEEALARIAPINTTTLPHGLIHADMFPDNVFFQGDDLSGIIDFYFACTDAFAYDIVIVINAWCFEADGAFNITKTAQLLRGYQSTRPLEAAEKDALPGLCVGSALRFLLTRLHDLIHHDDNALVSIKNPKEYLHKLQFHLQVKSVGEYGL